jgi:hypothetical protein
VVSLTTPSEGDDGRLPHHPRCDGRRGATTIPHREPVPTIAFSVNTYLYVNVITRPSGILNAYCVVTR